VAKTSIEWATDVWNPVTGCTKVSAGCKNCYAEKLAGRFWGDRKFTDVKFHPERLEDPFRWKKPRRVFVNSMSDLFHEKLDFAYILTIFYRMATYDRHTYIVLTKRANRMVEFFEFWQEHIKLCKAEGRAFFMPPLRNVWLGVSVENQQSADERIPYLLETPAAVRFVSVEPMLGEVDLTQAMYGIDSPGMNVFGFTDGFGYEACLHWVICGCESGQSARPFDMDWARDLRDQCQSADVPFFFKQGRTDGKLVKMPELDGIVWNELPRGSN
jgi:protein gp37